MAAFFVVVQNSAPALWAVSIAEAQILTLLVDLVCGQEQWFR